MKCSQPLSRLIAVMLLVCLASLATYVRVQADSHELTFVSDLISTSAPNAAATEIVTFTLTHAIPPSGLIIVTPEADAFAIPPSLDSTDIGFSVTEGGVSVDRPISALADATDDGVSVVSGIDGSITITLNSTTGINAGDSVKVSIGTQGAGVSILNPSSVRSYRISIKTEDQLRSPLDNGTAMIAIVDPVALRLPTDVLRPTLFNGRPSGEIAAGNPTIELSLQTLDTATCRFASSSGISYGAMPGSFTTSDGLTFYTALSGFQDGASSTFYVRCTNLLGNPNDADYPISFYLDPTPSVLTSGNGSSSSTAPGLGYLGPGGVGNIPNGSAYLFLSSVTLSGFTMPLSTVTILTDGTRASTVQSGVDGSFSALVPRLERGTYTFQAYVSDSGGATSASYAASLYLSQATHNNISNILIPPTIKLSSSSIGAGDDVSVSGSGIPNTPIEVDVRPGAVGAPLSSTRVLYASSTALGAWNLAVDTKAYLDGSYTVVAREIISSQSRSGYSTPLPLVVGAGSGSCSSSPDLNLDKKVNLIDFSIFLTFWNTTGPRGDFNCDSKVNLADFSIMLFNWTG